jgi:hypothetical protein
MAEQDEIQWVMVYSSSNEQEINLLQTVLEDNEIESVILNKKDSAYLFGDLELHVSTGDAFSASQLINQFFA